MCLVVHPSFHPGICVLTLAFPSLLPVLSEVGQDLCFVLGLTKHGWPTCRHRILEEDAKIEITDQTLQPYVL